MEHGPNNSIADLLELSHSAFIQEHRQTLHFSTEAVAHEFVVALWYVDAQPADVPNSGALAKFAQFFNDIAGMAARRCCVRARVPVKKVLASGASPGFNGELERDDVKAYFVCSRGP